MAIDLDRIYTLEEFLQLDLPDEDSTQYELIGGKIYSMKKNPGPSSLHAQIVTTIAASLWNFAGRGQASLGKVLSGSACEFPTCFLVPDVAFVLASRLVAEGGMDSIGPLTVIPDIVVEVDSPSDDNQKMFDKIVAYRAAGVPLIWSVQLLEKYVLVRHPQDVKPLLLGVEDELSGEDVLPGFKLPVRQLFE